jgi:hypothetical protein
LEERRLEPDARLLMSLAEHLKLPLTQIARQTELEEVSLETIRGAADNALRLVEGFLLSSYLHGQYQLQLEPVSLKAMLYDVAHELGPFAKASGCKLELSHKGSYGNVMAHRQALETAMMLIGHAFIEENQQRDKLAPIVLTAHKNSKFISTGVFSDNNLSSEAFNEGKELYGKAKQALPSTHSAPAAEIFVANSLLQGMASGLSVTHYRGLTGLVTGLLPSQQLKLV